MANIKLPWRDYGTGSTTSASVTVATGPRGPKGDRGDKGDTGATGPAGGSGFEPWIFGPSVDPNADGISGVEGQGYKNPTTGDGWIMYGGTWI